MSSPSIGISQSAGDVAFTGFNGEGSASLDGFSVVLFTGYSDGDEIHFSSQEWNGNTFAGSGGDFTWVAPEAGTSPGTVLVFEDVEGTPTVNIGSITNDADMNLSGSGDVIYAYTGADKDSPDTPFLGAIATDDAIYDNSDQSDGTLNNTGLTQGATAILLPNNIDNAEYIGSRSGNTPNGYRNELNIINGEDATDDNWDIYNGGDIAPFPPFDDTNFTVVNAPILQFVNSSTNAPEGSDVGIEVRLAESTNTEVSVDVVFLPGSSSASRGDIDSYTTQTVTFSSSDGDGTVRTVSATLTDDSEFEGDEIAVFQLRNNTAGSIIDPEELNFTINDNETPPIVINEFLADPPSGSTGDANGDGTRDSSEDEFMEIVNNSSEDIDISGWQLSDDGGSNITYTFPSGTILPANQAIVVFGGGNPSGNFGGAIIQTAGNLSFTNGGGFATLLNSTGDVIQNIAYGDEGGPDAGDDQSVTRDPDRTGSFVRHSNATGSGGSIFSPGTQVDGTAFGSTFAIGLRGNAGWRFVSTPAQSTSFDDLFADFWTQGIPGSDSNNSGDAANLYNWQESGGGTFATISSMDNNMEAGRGYIIFVYEDDDFRAPGIQGGFPKIISTDNAENSSPVSVAVSSNDTGGGSGIDENEGYNLLGNPFGTDISAAAVIDALEAVDPNVNTIVSVWDEDAGSGNGGYIPLDGSDGSADVIAPFQAFFIRYTADGVSGNASFDRSDLAANQGAQFYGQPGESNTITNFEIYLGDGNKFDTYRVAFREEGTSGEDRYDAYKLFSLNSDAISLFSTVGGDVRLAKNSLPSLESMDAGEEIRVSIGYDIPRSGEYTFSWDLPEQLPEDLELYLIDTETGREIDIRTQKELSVSLSQSENDQGNSVRSTSPAMNKTNISDNGDRFELVIRMAEDEISEPQPMDKPVSLTPNYPNPFNSQTKMDLSLNERMHVKVTIWNIVGQKVVTLKDEMMDAVSNEPLSWSVPAGMPSGIYICKVEAGGMVITRKMTLVK